MNHAILIKTKSIPEKLFSMSFASSSPSFEFDYQYTKAILKSSYTKGVFDWTNGTQSEINIQNYGSFYPTQMMLTKKLHSYPGYHHNYELIIKHTGNADNQVFFVFFLQGTDDSPEKENSLDLFLKKKTTVFDATDFLKDSLSATGNNVYYRSDKTKDHVFIFPKVIVVENKSLLNITRNTKSAAHIYREILLREYVIESDLIPIEYGTERVVEPVSQNIRSKPKTTTVTEPFATTQTCYPIDDSGETYAQVVIGSGTYVDGDEKAVGALEDTQMIFAYGILVVVMLFVFGSVTSELVGYTLRNEGQIGAKIMIAFMSFAFFAVGFSIPIAKLGERNKKGGKQMKLSTASANVIGFVFLFATAVMWASAQFTCSKMCCFFSGKLVGVVDLMQGKEGFAKTFLGIFFPYFCYGLKPKTSINTGTQPV